MRISEIFSIQLNILFNADILYEQFPLEKKYVLANCAMDETIVLFVLYELILTDHALAILIYSL